MDILGVFCDRFEFVSKCFSSRVIRRLEHDLHQAKIDLTAEQYLSICFGISVVMLVLTLSMVVITTIAIGFAFILFAASFYVLLKYPKIKKKRIGSEIEKELPFAMRSFGTMLNMNLSFEKCLEKIANSNYKNLSKEFRIIVSDINSGSSIESSLQNFSDRISSILVKRTVSSLITSYQKGGDGEVLKNLADEQSAILQARLREYSGKLMMYSLLFIAFSAVLPAMFQAFVVIGSNFLEMPISPDMALIIPVVGFPLINISILFVMKWKRP